ncbi:DsbE family thiol:disulfide interchange protein [Arenibacterium sp. CAU 1754]
MAKKISPLMLAPPIIFIAFVLLAAIGMFRNDPESLPSARQGQTAPPLVLTPLEGKTGFDDATLRDGQVKLVNFWASWCAPCRVEHPNLEALAGEGVTIYGINYKDDPVKALAFLDELGDPYAATAADAQGRTALDWGVYGVPETYVIDGSGTILLRHAGPVTQRVIEETLRPAIEAAQSN